MQRVVFEEGTGTWCPYCIRGIEGFNYMTEKYPDTFIGIAVHKDDQFATSSYDKLTFTGYPSSYAMRDRSQSINPSSANLEGVYKVIAAQQPVASVGVVAGYTDASKTTFTVRTNLNFFTAKSGLNYRLSYVLLESGGMIAYQQGYNKDTEMNHVARMNYSFDGFSNSVPKSVEEEEDVESFRDLEMPTTVRNKDNVELVCLLIDGISGHIVNAAKCEIDAEAPVSAIREARQQLVPVFTVSNGQLNLNGYRGTVSVYDASGKQVSADHLQAGLYILRATDGNRASSGRWWSAKYFLVLAPSWRGGRRKSLIEQDGRPWCFPPASACIFAYCGFRYIHLSKDNTNETDPTIIPFCPIAVSCRSASLSPGHPCPHVAFPLQAAGTAAQRTLGAIWAPAPTGLPAAPTMASWPSRQAATPPSPTCSSMRSIRCRPMVAARSTTDSTTRSTTSRRKIC